MLGVRFFFSSRRRHTRLTCDWSSDVCSSDLARVRTALVQLAGGVEVARAVPVRDDTAGARAELAGELCDAPVVLLRWRDEGLNARVVALARLRDELVDRSFGLELRILARREHLVRLVLRRLHVGLVERVDLEPGRGDGDRELPAEELAAERRCAVEVGRRPLPVGTLGRLARRGNEPLAELAGGLGDELLRPQAEP